MHFISNTLNRVVTYHFLLLCILESYPGDNVHGDVLHISRLTAVSREAKKKQAVRDERVCYLQVAPL